MDKKNISFDYQIFQFEELNDQNKKLVVKVKEASIKAFAPYSHFHVGAGVMLENGEIITSTNQESEVFPSGICAERSLLYFVQANYSENRIVAMAVTAPPCGACRQVMVDTEKRNAHNIPIFIIKDTEIMRIDCAKDLLPITFCL